MRSSTPGAVNCSDGGEEGRMIPCVRTVIASGTCGLREGHLKKKG